MSTSFLEKCYPHVSDDEKLVTLSETGDEKSAVTLLFNNISRLFFQPAMPSFLPSFNPNSDAHTPKQIRCFDNPVDNGDCVFSCLSFFIHCMSGAPISIQITDEQANSLRQQVRAYILLHWDDVSTTLRGTWASRIDMERIALDDEEMPCDDNLVQAKWLERIDTLGHVGLVEMCAFLEMAEENGVPISIRIFRRHNYKLVCSAILPDVPPAGPRHVLDLILTGPVGSEKSHYKVLKSGSLHGSLRASSNSVTGRKRMRHPDLARRVNVSASLPEQFPMYPTSFLQ